MAYLPFEVFTLWITIARGAARCPLLHFLNLLVDLQLLGIFIVFAF